MLRQSCIGCTGLAALHSASPLLSPHASLTVGPSNAASASCSPHGYLFNAPCSPHGYETPNQMNHHNRNVCAAVQNVVMYRYCLQRCIAILLYRLACYPVSYTMKQYNEAH